MGWGKYLSRAKNRHEVLVSSLPENLQMRVNHRAGKSKKKKKKPGEKKMRTSGKAKQEKSNCRHLTPGNKKTEENSK